MRYWLMKTEPGVFSIEDLARAPRSTTSWDGVRNFQARNMLRDEMKKGDLVFLYYSSTDVPGIVGVMEVTKDGHPDTTAFDRKHDHHDPESDPKNPRWFMIDVRLKERFGRTITLSELRKHAGKRAERDDAAASGQSFVGNAGRTRTLEVHSLTRVMR